jgi:tetratricopeptide (TPR) repeat protein
MRMNRGAVLSGLLALVCCAVFAGERGDAFKNGHEATADAEKIKWFKKALELCKADEHIPRCWAFNNIGYVYIKANKWDEALENMEKAVAEYDKIDVAWNNLGIVYENLYFVKNEKDRSYLAKAKEAYEKAIALKPDMELYRLNKTRAETLLNLKDEKQSPAPK